MGSITLEIPMPLKVNKRGGELLARNHDRPLEATPGTVVQDGQVVVVAQDQEVVPVTAVPADHLVGVGVPVPTRSCGCGCYLCTSDPQP